MTTTSNPTIGIIGFGFSGLMVTANLLRRTNSPLTIYVVAPDHDARGVAYSTNDPTHLLNVQAQRMGAWDDAPRDFFRWLQTDAAKYIAAQKKLGPYTDPTAYIPRMMFGEYLVSIWCESQEIAAQKNCSIKLVPSEAVALRDDGETLAILTERGDAIAVQHAVLAIGNEAKHLYPHLPRGKVVQQPWAPHALDGIAANAQHIAIVGTGLTTVDTILSLRNLGFRGKITALSHFAQLPCAHNGNAGTFSFSVEKLLQHSVDLSHLLHFVRRTLREYPGDWRDVIDAIRPHAQVIWRQLKTPDKKRFFRKLSHRWGIYRHRMAGQVAAQLDAEIAAQRLSLIPVQQLRAEMAGDQLMLHWVAQQKPHQLSVDTVVNCTGVAMHIKTSKRPLLLQLQSAAMIEPHATEVGIAVDANYRVMGAVHEKFYAMGALLTGQLMESIAVPELRGQACSIARAILREITRG